MPTSALCCCALEKGTFLQFSLLDSRLAVETRSTSITGNSDAGWNTSCFTHSRRDIFVIEKQKCDDDGNI